MVPFNAKKINPGGRCGGVQLGPHREFKFKLSSLTHTKLRSNIPCETCDAFEVNSMYYIFNALHSNIFIQWHYGGHKETIISNNVEC